MKALIMISVAALLCACSSKHELAKCKGPLIALNSGHWAPTPDELSALNKLCPEDR
jgi:hypothetical protein